MFFIRFDGEKFQEAELSSFEHYESKLANYREKGLVTGCSSDKICGIKTEIIDMTTLKWSSRPDYTFASVEAENEKSFIYGYSTISVDDAAFIIGGGGNENTITEFRDDHWRKHGSLQQRRLNHDSIAYEKQIMIIGGWKNYDDIDL